MMPLAEAVQRVLRDARPLAIAPLPLVEAAGRVLAEPVRAACDLPPWDNSAMDGYAVRAADVRGASAAAPVELRVVESIVAGAFPSRRVEAGEAARIMTGAPMPDGADCVIRVEDTDDGRNVVRVVRDRDAGRHVRPRGEDVRAGDIALDGGVPLTGHRIGLLAALGAREVPVHRRPRVAVLSSGDELVPLERADEAVRGERIVASNGYALAALLRADGADVVELGIAPDDPAALAERARGAEACDLLVTTAGASIGEHDHTRRALEQLGLALDFWRVRVRPGSQTSYGRLEALGGIAWLGLPGNPVSALVTYELFVRPLLRVWCGHRAAHRCAIPVIVDEPVRAASPDFTFLPRVRLSPADDGLPRARLTGPQGTGLQTSMARADALLVVREGTGGIDAGATAQALLLDDDTLHTAESCW